MDEWVANGKFLCYNRGRNRIIHRGGVSMREVLKFSKNYLTGETFTEKVTKKSDQLIGRATIEVRDNKGDFS